MLTNISGRRSLDAPHSTPLDMLQECHARIRHFLQLSRTLADARDVPQTEIASAAAAIHRYFSQALPLHEADENQTLFPRFRDAFPPGAPLREAARIMVEQHEAIEELAAELLSLCGALQRNPERLPGYAGRLQHVTAALAQIFASHLHMEETVLFPALQHFTPAQLDEMSREMQQRRRPQRKPIHLVC